MSSSEEEVWDGGLSSDEESTVVFQGQRKGRLYQMGNHYYHKEKSYPSRGKTYYKCAEYKTLQCSARAESFIGVAPVVLRPRPGYMEHTHEPNPHYGTYLDMRHEVIDLMLSQEIGTSQREVFLNYKAQ